MSVTLITGPHQSGKSWRLWQRLRAEPLGTAVLVRPTAGMPVDLLRQITAWGGPGLLPPVWSFQQLCEQCAAGAEQLPAPCSLGWATHVLRAYATTQLRSTWSALGRYRATGHELADLCLRLDAHGVTEADFSLVERMLRERGDLVVVEHWRDVQKALAHLTATAQKYNLALPGTRLRTLAAQAAMPPKAVIYIDDFQMFSPAELELLRAIGISRNLVISAIDDGRLGVGASLADRLRSAMPDALEERLPHIAATAPQSEAVKSMLSGILDDSRVIPASALSYYRYRDPIHAGRAVAAWLRKNDVAPAQAIIVMRVADAQALALADALIAAEVPVSGSFQVPFLSTTAGGTFAALVAWCRFPTWGHFLSLVERLAIMDPPLVRLSDIVGPWARSPVAEGFKRLETLIETGISGSWGWQEPERKTRPWLSATRTWLLAWEKRLAGEGTWWERLQHLCTVLDTSDGGSGVLRTLHELHALHPVSGEDIDELLMVARVTVERDGGAQALIMTDAVRGRTVPRSVVLIHDLEHGRWPGQVQGGALFPLDERRLLSSLLARDLYDESGRAGGEMAAFLAVIGRATKKVVLGIPCGEREANPWLGSICEQAGWDLEQLRCGVADEAVPGAPLGNYDAQGAHEHALWSVTPANPQFTFRVPAQPPHQWGIKASGLSAVFHDSFSLVCDHLCLSEPLLDRDVMEEGNELHDVLAELANHPPSAWAHQLPTLLHNWVVTCDDLLKQAERRRLAVRVIEVMTAEAQTVAEAKHVEAEKSVVVPITIPDHEPLRLRGRIDRVDHLHDGSVRVVDYKRGAITTQASQLAKGSDGQLLGYLLAAAANNWPVSGAYYLSLRAGTRAGWGTIPTPSGKKPSKPGQDLAEVESVTNELGRCLAELASGITHADPEGRSAADYAPIARLDEHRLQAGEETS
jgi:RecB family exonuclease